MPDRPEECELPTGAESLGVRVLITRNSWGQEGRPATLLHFIKSVQQGETQESAHRAERHVGLIRGKAGVS